MSHGSTSRSRWLRGTGSSGGRLGAAPATGARALRPRRHAVRAHGWRGVPRDPADRCRDGAGRPIGRGRHDAVFDGGGVGATCHRRPRCRIYPDHDPVVVAAGRIRSGTRRDRPSTREQATSERSTRMVMLRSGSESCNSERSRPTSVSGGVDMTHPADVGSACVGRAAGGGRTGGPFPPSVQNHRIDGGNDARDHVVGNCCGGCCGRVM
jgi:hypothetical protein